MAAPVNPETIITIRDICYAAGVLIALGSAFVSVLTYRKTVKRDLNAQGDSELKLYEIIAKAEKDAVDFNLKFLADEIKAPTEAVDSAQKAYIQYMLNSYDIGCQRYLDGKLDKERFQKTYKQRILQLYGNSLYQEQLNPGTFKYAALDRVNNELNNPEGKA
ncbi:hypothetical protein [Pantoea septica]|uniref:hypothetical protein n=1 Tax=Pantoea septica TaxID=472695 RepID=UPI0025FF69DE|nr:hypothetical protein [Pantoea septica]